MKLVVGEQYVKKIGADIVYQATPALLARLDMIAFIYSGRDGDTIETPVMFGGHVVGATHETLPKPKKQVKLPLPLKSVEGVRAPAAPDSQAEGIRL